VEQPHRVELLGIADGKHLEQQSVERAEDGGVGANAESEGENSGEGESGRFGELAERVAKVLKERGHAKPPTEGTDLA
jgi:hypothetical protein